MSLNGVISSFSTGSYTRTRTSVGTTVDGTYVEGSTSTSSILGSLQPVTGDLLKSLPEGRRADEVKVLYTTSDVIVKPIPDKFTIDGEQWETEKVMKWEHFGETHYIAFVSNIQVP